MELNLVVCFLAFVATLTSGQENENVTENEIAEGKKIAKRDVFYLGYGSNNKIYAIPQPDNSTSAPFSFVQPTRSNQNQYASGYKVNEEKQQGSQGLFQSYDGEKEEMNDVNDGQYQNKNQQEQAKSSQSPQPFDIIKLIQENALRQAAFNYNNNNNMRPLNMNMLTNRQFNSENQVNPQYAPNPFSRYFHHHQHQHQQQQQESNNRYMDGGNEDQYQDAPTTQPMHVVQPIVLNNLNDLPQLIAATLNRNINANNNQRDDYETARSASSLSDQFKIVPTVSTTSEQLSKLLSSLGSANNNQNEQLKLYPSAAPTEQVKVLSSNSIIVPSSQLYRLAGGRAAPSAIINNHSSTKRSFDSVSEENLSAEMPAGDMRRSYDYDQYPDSGAGLEPQNQPQNGPVAKEILNVPTFDSLEAQDRIGEQPSFQGLPNYLSTQVPTVPTKFLGLGVNPNHALQQSLERYAKIAGVLNNQRQQETPTMGGGYEALMQSSPNDDYLGINRLTGPMPTAVVLNDNNHIAFLNSLADRRKSFDFVENNASHPFAKFTNTNTFNKNLNRHHGHDHRGNSDHTHYGFQSINLYDQPEQKTTTEKPNIIIYPIVNSGLQVRPDDYPQLVQKILGEKFEDIKKMLSQQQHVPGATYHIPDSKQQQQQQLFDIQNNHLSGGGGGGGSFQSKDPKQPGFQREGRMISVPHYADYHIIRTPMTHPLSNKFSFISFTLGGDARHKRRSNK